MKKTISLTLLFLFTLSTFVFSVPSSGYACSCVTPSPVKEAVDMADAVFVGKVTKILEPKPDAQGLISSADPVDVTFEVSQFWKGISQKQVTIKTALSSASCGFSFEDDKEYIVYAYKNESNVLETNICTRTRELSVSAEDLASLGKGKTLPQDAQPPMEEASPGKAKSNGLFTSPYLWVTGIVTLAGVTYLLIKKGKKS